MKISNLQQKNNAYTEHLPQIQYCNDGLFTIAFGLMGSAIGCIFVLLFSYFDFKFKKQKQLLL